MREPEFSTLHLRALRLASSANSIIAQFRLEYHSVSAAG
jgi:hypothetical protein